MRNFLAAVWSVIAVGVLLIAYGLLSPRAAAAPAYPYARPMLASQAGGDIEDLTPRESLRYRISDGRAVPVSYQTYDEPRRVMPVRTRTVRVAARPARRDWGKTAMVIGGSTAAGAGLGAIFGGKKGALIGAAIGGGAGTLFEVRK